MSIYTIFALGVSASTLVTASILGHSHSLPVKRSNGIVAGEKNGTSYSYNLTTTSAQCPTLLAADLQTSLEEFDGLFPPEYDAGSSGSQDSWDIGALYLTYSEGTFAFDLEYTSVTPNSTATWIDTGVDIENVWTAVREDIVQVWSEGTNFQWVWYDINKTVDGVSNYAGEFRIQIQTPSFVKGCDTSCGGDCDPNICTC
ncbi:hypothetical protein N0V93_009601 [Gnomoniopsis smithogilvyi]|uniref:Uncharacterized protein n=1 Tax=Gnomoniopsis smithogilvyi TaxID=1191159 RepID=A0A9W8YMC2_9PEZI|nr:hypothetical protein N0V93_009601 [Gnomoniopsis smithogilvyi]